MTRAGAGAANLRLGVIGCGRIGQLHARAITGSTRGTLVAVCDVLPERAAAAAAAFGARPYPALRELLAHEAIDAVTIATPDHLHLAPVLEAIAADCHVFCEKPLATSLADAERMVEAAAVRGVQLAVDYNRRFGFAYRQAKALVDAGRIGAVSRAVIRVTDRTPPPDVAREPHVILTTLLTHHLDLIRFVCGEVASVHARFAPDRRDGLVRDVVLSLRCAEGAIGAIVAGYRDGLGRTSERMELFGSEGELVIEDVTRRVLLMTREPDRIESFRPNPFEEGDAFHDTLRAHLCAFIEQVAGGLPPPVRGVDGLCGMRLAAAALEAHRRSCAIEVTCHDRSEPSVGP
jgi:predicted dehydrogenase